ncbi:MAG: hypothetical protein V4735_09625 [Pseudomonadota bacterium]
MKTVFKAVLLVTALMAAQPALAHDHKHKSKKSVNCEHSERRADRKERYDNRYDNSSNYRSERQGTFLGYPIQTTRNPGDVRDDTRRVRSSH